MKNDRYVFCEFSYEPGASSKSSVKRVPYLVIRSNSWQEQFRERMDMFEGKLHMTFLKKNLHISSGF